MDGSSQSGVRRDIEPCLAASCLGPVQKWVTKQGDPPPTSHSRPGSFLVQILTISCVPARFSNMGTPQAYCKRPAFISSSRPPRTYKDPRCPPSSPHHRPTVACFAELSTSSPLYAFLRSSNLHRHHAIQQGVQRPFPVLGQAPDRPSPDAGVIAN